MERFLVKSNPLTSFDNLFTTAERLLAMILLDQCSERSKEVENMKIACVIAIALLVGVVASAQTNSYTAAPIVNNTQDPFLVNPWGLSRPAKSSSSDNEWWASDNATGYTTLYYADKSGAQSLEIGRASCRERVFLSV